MCIGRADQVARAATPSISTRAPSEMTTIWTRPQRAASKVATGKIRPGMETGRGQVHTSQHGVVPAHLDGSTVRTGGRDEHDPAGPHTRTRELVARRVRDEEGASVRARPETSQSNPRLRALGHRAERPCSARRC